MGYVPYWYLYETWHLTFFITPLWCFRVSVKLLDIFKETLEQLPAMFVTL